MIKKLMNYLVYVCCTKKYVYVYMFSTEKYLDEQFLV